MKLAIAALVLAQISSGLAFSQSAQKAGDWYVYTFHNSSSKQAETLIQTTSKEQYANNRGELVAADLDVVCAKGKLVAVAVDTNSIVPQSSVNLGGAVDMIPVSYELGDQAAKSESWAVFDHGRTLSPYAEILQGRRTQEWADRMAKSDTIVLHFDGSASAHMVTATFATAGFVQALSAANCN